MTGYVYAPQYWDAGWVPLPLPHGLKKSPPTGTTGRGAREITADQIQDWVHEDEDANIALRLPKNVVGLDFDLYKAEGRESWAKMNELHGPLPATWRSTSRTDGSGILLFRTDPERTDNLRDPVGNGKGGFEIIRWSHRYVIVGPSLSPPPPIGSGQTYVWLGPDGQRAKCPRVEDLPLLPQSWLDALTPEARPEHSAATVELTEAGLAKASAYEQKAVQGAIGKLKAMSAAATADAHTYRGDPWDQTTFYVAARLFEIANADWSTLTVQDVGNLVHQYAPRDAGFTSERIQEKIMSAHRTTVGKVAAPPTGGTGPRTDDSFLFPSLRAGAQPTQAAPGGEVAPRPRVIAHGNEVDVSNHSLAAQWLLETVGTGHLSGMFFRKGELVYTPQIGEQGYVAPRNAEAEGVARITVMTEHDLQARIQHRYDVVRTVVDREATAEAKEMDKDAPEVWKAQPVIFPLESAKVVVRAPDDAPNLRELHGVVHAPTFRPDGTLITMPGYDDATGILFLPIGGQPGAIPDVPTIDDVRLATSWLDFMLQDFRFVTANDRASYIGLMLTPLLRTLIPSPYKLGVIEAHQPGSGKSFLGRALTSVHGGTMHAELPADEPELTKVVGSILDTQTSPVIVFDNVTGVVRSPTLAGLLTSPTYQGRRLGSSTVIEADNDRLWVITANNASLGGDLGRRNVRVRIDPGVPNPELRTGFAIDNFEAWVRANRGSLLWSLLVLVRHWAANGQRLFEKPTGDSYGRWASTIRAILLEAGIPGTFDAPETRSEAADPEADEFQRFLEIVMETMGDRDWTAKSLLGLVRHPSSPIDDGSKPIPFDALPADLLRGKTILEPATLSTSLGRWLLNRKGRYFGDLCVKQSGEKHWLNGTSWKVERYVASS